MKVYSFFRLLNKKIKQYEKNTSNPFKPKSYKMIVIWVEDINEKT